MEQPSPCKTTTEPALQQPGITTTATCGPSVHAPQEDRPPQREALTLQQEQPPLIRTRKKPSEQRRPSTAKNNDNNKTFKKDLK